MALSKFQTAIVSHVRYNSTKSAVVGAGAGCGKTFTLKACATALYDMGETSILMLAFNKSIASELQSKMGKIADCKTLHSQGCGALLKAISTILGKKGAMDYKKWGDYIRNNYAVLSSYDFDTLDEKSRNNTINEYCTNVKNIFDKCRVELIQEGDKEGISNVIDHYGLDTMADEENAVSMLLGVAYELTDTYDFTDMLTIPAMNNSVKKYIRKYKHVFIDECQDLSKAQQALMTASIAKGGRFIAVGDRHQAINGFAGADNNSFQRLVDLAQGVEFPLSTCYRCGRKIVESANQIVPELEATDNAQEGNVCHATNFDELQKGDMIICRKSAPLLGLALKMIAKGMPAKVKGTDLAEALIKMVTKYKAKNIYSLYSKLDEEYQKILNEVAKKGHTNPAVSVRARNFMDKYECIKVVADECTTIAEIKHKLETIFSDYKNDNQITLSTIHKAKGLEADNVWIILPDKLPLTFKGQKEWELEQEMNLKYVAITRAKKNLIWVDLDEDHLTNIHL